MKAKAYIVHRAMCEPELEWSKPKDCLSAEPLYTSQPAQRKPWVGLTDEDISKMPSWIYSPDQDGMTAEEGLEVFARAIEAKLREKNT